MFEPKGVAPDLQAMVSTHHARHERMQSRLSLLMWGMKCFNRESDETHDPDAWRERLADALALRRKEPTGDDVEPGNDAPAFVAGVCTRDHWDDLKVDEQEWCAAVICEEIERRCDEWDRMAGMQRYAMGGDRPAAWAVSDLVTKLAPGTIRDRALRALVLALTHAVDEVKDYAASGVGLHLWSEQRALALRCVKLLAAEASALRAAIDAESSLPYGEQRPSEEISQEVAESARQQFEDGATPDVLADLDANHWVGAQALSRIVMMLEHVPTEGLAAEMFSRVAGVLTGWWDDTDSRTERPFETESVLREVLERFLLRVTPRLAVGIINPIVDAVQSHPRDTYWVLIGLIGIEDRQPNTETFWAIWERFADAVRSASWLQRIDDEHPFGGLMLSAVFLGTQWKDEVRHWRSLEGHSHHVHRLFEDLPSSASVLEDYLSFLFHVGEQSLPDAYIRIARRVKESDPSQLLQRRNAVFLLESLLGRYVYGRPAELKRSRELRDAVLDLLDALVDVGSAAAFRMRDDFVTPLKGE